MPTKPTVEEAMVRLRLDDGTDVVDGHERRRNRVTADLELTPG